MAQPAGVTRLVDPANGANWAELTHPDQSHGTLIAFSPNQAQLITVPYDEHDTAHIWDLVAIRRELAARGLDWPADVLRAKLDSSSEASLVSRLEVTLDAGVQSSAY